MFLQIPTPTPTPYTRTPQSLPPTFPSLRTHANILLGARYSLIRRVTNIRAEKPGTVVRLPHRIFSPERPNKLCRQYSLLFNGYRELFPYDNSGRSVTLSTDLHLESRLVMIGAKAPNPTESSVCVLVCLCACVNVYMEIFTFTYHRAIKICPTIQLIQHF
jgi:hypothetical protein